GGKQVLVLDELSIGYDHELARLSLDLYSGSKVAILGPNGCGKSTLLKTVAGKINRLEGEFMLGHQIMPGYFDQDVSGFVASKSVLQELWDDFPGLTQTQVRSALGAFLFEQDDVFKLIQDLSGGEKVRLLLAKLMLRQDNFLLLDEPTNHLDLLSKEALEEALQEYDGTMLFVSHDRYFISKLATALLVYEHDHFVYYPMTYEEYTQAQKVQEEQKKVKETTLDRRSERKAITREIKKLEAQMEQLETELAQESAHRFEEDYYNDYQKMQVLEAKIASLEEKFEKCLNLLEEYSNMMIEAGD
ncbi:MAG: ATP-binding cassette domain-containing protein, partial [Erysipelotrichaceae bacterium]